MAISPEVQAWIDELAENRSSALQEPLKSDIDTVIAALTELSGTASAAALTPYTVGTVYTSVLSQTSQNHPTQGNLIRPWQDFQIVGLHALLGANVVGAEYQANVYQIDGANTITAILGEAPLYTADDTFTRAVYFDFPAPVPVLTGNRYWIGYRRTNNGDTGNCFRAYAGTGAFWVFDYPIMGNTAVQFLGMDKAVPAVGDTFTVGPANPIILPIAWTN